VEKGKERGRGHFLSEEVEDQVENTSRNVGIRIVWKQRKRIIVKRQMCEWKIETLEEDISCQKKWRSS